MTLTLLTFAFAFCLGQGSASNYGQSRQGGGGIGGGGGGTTFTSGRNVSGTLNKSGRSELAGERGLVPDGINFISYNPNDNSLVTSDAARSGDPEDDQTPGLWQVKSQVLTPGEHFDFRLQVQDGETLLAGATSDAFDPALSLEDSHGTVLIKNDDRADGDQSPFISYRFARGEDYTLKVLSFRSVAGGKFVLSTRRFFSAEMPLGHKTIESASFAKQIENQRVLFHISAKKGTIYDLHMAGESLKSPDGHNQTYLLGFRRVISPTGVIANDLAPIGTPDGSAVFQALIDGDFYAEYMAIVPAEPLKPFGFETDLRAVQTIGVKTSDEVKLSFEPNELKLVEFPVKRNLIVRTSLKGTAFQWVISAPDHADTLVAAQASVHEGGGAYADEAAWAWFRPNVDSSNDFIRIFHYAGTARVAIRSQLNTPEDITLGNAESLPTWSAGSALKESLNIGESHFYLIQSTKSELMRVSATAEHFLPRLDIFRMNGELANSLVNRQTHVAGDDLYFPEAAIFVVRLSCEGDGGSGDFALKRTELEPIPYQLGTTTTLNLDGKNFGLYAVDLKAGQRYELLIDNRKPYLEDDLLDDDGQFLSSQNIGFDRVSVHYFVPTKSGRHRLWLRGGPGTHQFKLQVHTPPSLGKS